MLYRLIVITLVGLMFTLRLPAQPGNATLIVSLVDQQGSIIPGADLTLNPADSKKSRTQSNDDGVATFKHLTSGKYQLNIKLQGFSDYKTDEFVLAAGETKRLTLILEPASI